MTVFTGGVLWQNKGHKTILTIHDQGAASERGGKRMDLWKYKAKERLS